MSLMLETQLVLEQGAMDLKMALEDPDGVLDAFHQIDGALSRPPVI